MFKRPQVLSLATAVTLLAIGAAAPAADIDKTRYFSEIRSCVAEVGEHANYTDAIRVQHTVVEKSRTQLGFVFSIATSVYTDAQEDAIRTYTSQCVARGNDTLVKFTIDEV